MSREILQPPGWARPRGYANGVAATGRQVYVAGQIGWDAEQRFASDDFAAQVRQALANVVAVLRCACPLVSTMITQRPGPHMGCSRRRIVRSERRASARGSSSERRTEVSAAAAGQRC